MSQVRDADEAVCVVCGEPASLARGAVVRVPGERRWWHVRCLGACPELAAAAARHVQRAFRFREPRRLTPAAR